MKKLKIAVIGVGSISSSHISAYKKNPNVELYAFCDINEERLKKQGERFDLRVHYSWTKGREPFRYGGYGGKLYRFFG